MAIARTGDNDFGVARIIVSPTIASGATHTTIASALADASASGITVVYVKPGVYTENLTLISGIDIVSYGAYNQDPSQTAARPTIIGKLTATFSGKVTIYGIQLQTNSDLILAASTGQVKITFDNCLFFCNSSTGISFTPISSGSFLRILNCQAELTNSNILFQASSLHATAIVQLYNLQATSNDNTSAASTITTGLLQVYYSDLNFPITTSSTNGAIFKFSTIDTSANNSTALTIGGSGTNTISHCKISSGSASAISIGGTVSIDSSSVSSSNTNAITGAGTINYNAIDFIGSSSNINTTTQSVFNIGPSATVGSTNSGNTNTLKVTNPSNTASSQSNIVVDVGGGTSADPFTTYTVTGSTSWSTGIDNSASDAYVVAASTALGTTNVMSMDTGGNVSCVLGDLDVTRSSSGANVSFTTSNSSNTASSNASIISSVGGTSAGDAVHQSVVSGTTTWTWGIDNSVTSPTADPWVLSQGTALGTNNVMSVATSGEINYPMQPAFLARSSLHSDVTGDGTTYTIIFDSEQFDQNSDYDNTTGVFTAPVAGRYFFTTSIYVGDIGASHTSLLVQFAGNGVEVIRINPSAISVSGNFSITGSAIVNMAASATCSVALTVSGSTKTVDVNAGPPYNSFGGYLIC